jgi:hypothetical protein
MPFFDCLLKVFREKWPSLMPKVEPWSMVKQYEVQCVFICMGVRVQLNEIPLVIGSTLTLRDFVVRVSVHHLSVL